MIRIAIDGAVDRARNSASMSAKLTGEFAQLLTPIGHALA
jgi:hypothetical protein